MRLAYFLQQGVMSRMEISLEEAMEFEILWRTTQKNLPTKCRLQELGSLLLITS